VDKNEVAAAVQRALKKLGYYKGEITGIWDAETENAFRDFMLINNFENKMRKDNYIWGTVYRYLIELSSKR